MKKSIVTIALCLVALVAFGQKDAIKEVKKELKEKAPKFADARKLMKQALENPETKDLAETWYLAGSVEDSQFNAEVLKEQFGQTPDYAKMYTALDAVYPFFEKAFELDNLPDKKGKVKPKYTKDIRSIMKANRMHYINSGSHFYNNQQWEKAYAHFLMFMNMPQLPLMEGEPFESYPDSLMYQVSYFTGLAAIAAEKHEDAIRILNDLKPTGYNDDKVYQLLTEEYDRTGDKENYLKMLDEGCEKFPTNSYFILNSINVALESENTQKAISLLTTAINNINDDPMLYCILGQVYRQDKQYDKTVEMITKSIELDPSYVEGYTQLGNTYYIIAEETRLQYEEMERVDKKKAEGLYEKALEEYKLAIPYYKKAVELDNKNSVAVINLRFIYYITTDPGYDEIDKIFNALYED